MNVVFRVDSSIELGFGHVMRCITLAKQLLTNHTDVSFICRKLPGNIITLVKEKDISVNVLTDITDMNSSLINWYNHNWETDAIETKNRIKCLPFVDLLVVDHYGLDYKWEKEFKGQVGKIMVIDDLANRNHDCDILLDQNYYLNYEERYNRLVPPHCKKLLGPNYVLLRDEFIRKQNVRIRDKIKNILVFFGGTDPTNETMKALKALEHVNKQELVVNVIVGLTNRYKTEIENYCDKHDHYHFYCQVSTMADFINEADIAIGAGGTATWERCFSGLPTLVIMVAENQVEITKAVTEYGAVINLGLHNEVSAKDIAEKLSQLISFPEKVMSLSTNAASLVNRDVIKAYPVLNAIKEEVNESF